MNDSKDDFGERNAIDDYAHCLPRSLATIASESAGEHIKGI